MLGKNKKAKEINIFDNIPPICFSSSGKCNILPCFEYVAYSDWLWIYMLGKNKKAKEINIFDNIPNFMDLIVPDTLQERKDYLCLGYNKYSRVFVMTVYPEQFAF